MRSDVRTSQARRSELVKRIGQRQEQQLCFARAEEHAGFGASLESTGPSIHSRTRNACCIRVFQGKNSLKSRVPQLLQAPALPAPGA